jgi:hypothetical protein
MKKHVQTILLAGSVAGVLDISSAFVLFGLRGISALRVLQGIASGALGARSYRGGVATGLLGAGFHFLIAFSATAIYYAASRRIKLLTRYPVTAGLTYGVLVYTFMNAVVLPLSAVFPRRSPSISDVAIGMSILCCLVGLPISLIVSHADDSRTQERLPKRSAGSVPVAR